MKQALLATAVVFGLLCAPEATRAQQSRLNAEDVSVQIGDSLFAVGFDVLPLPGIRGFPFPRSANTLKARIVFGGQLGVAEIPIGRNLEGRVFILLPPARPVDGEPDYQVWVHRDVIAQYRGAAAVLIVSLDLTPLTVVRSVMEWRNEVAPADPRNDTPPVLVISHAAANAMLGAELANVRIGTATNEVRIKFGVQTKK